MCCLNLDALGFLAQRQEHDLMNGALSVTRSAQSTVWSPRLLDLILSLSRLEWVDQRVSYGEKS